MGEYFIKHGDAVKDIAFQVEDCDFLIKVHWYRGPVLDGDVLVDVIQEEVEWDRDFIARNSNDFHSFILFDSSGQCVFWNIIYYTALTIWHSSSKKHLSILIKLE